MFEPPKLRRMLHPRIGVKASAALELYNPTNQSVARIEREGFLDSYEQSITSIDSRELANIQYSWLGFKVRASLVSVS